MTDFTGSVSRRCLLAAAFVLERPEWLDVTGADVPGSCWRREGEVLHALAPRQAFHDLRSSREVVDFDFAFEFRLAPGANSGVKYLLHKVDVWAHSGSAEKQARARGFEFQLIDDAAEDARKDPAHVTGALYGILAPSRRTPNAADGRFHTALIRRRAASVEHHVDGVLVLQARLDDPAIQAVCRLRKMPPYAELASRGTPVALQHHNSEVWFRNLQLRSA